MKDFQRPVPVHSAARILPSAAAQSYIQNIQPYAELPKPSIVIPIPHWMISICRKLHLAIVQ